MLVAVWVILSFIVGILGRKTVLGFWGAFIFSLFFTPVLVLLYVVLAKKEKEPNTEE